jgi:hypothetical protein
MTEPELCDLCADSFGAQKHRVKTHLSSLDDAENIDPEAVYMCHECYLSKVLVPNRKLAKKKVLCNITSQLATSHFFECSLGVILTGKPGG